MPGHFGKKHAAAPKAVAKSAPAPKAAKTRAPSAPAAKTRAPSAPVAAFKKGGAYKPKGYFLGGLFGGSPGKSTSYQTSSWNQNFDPVYTSLMHKVMQGASGLMDTTYKPYDESKRFADFNADQNASFQGVRDAQGNAQPFMDNAQDALTTAAGYDAFGSAQPWLNKAQNTSTATAAANPWMTAAGQTLPEGLNGYMSPYTDAVVNRIADLGARNLNEKLLPGVNDAFTGASFGRDRHADFTARALRDTQESILGQQAQALESGYGTAVNAFNADKNRQAGLAGTAGQLASTDVTNAGNLANTSANIQNAAKAGDIALGQAQAGLGQTVQDTTYRDASALANSGAQQQAQAQKGADFSYQQNQEAKNWPFQMLDWAKSIGTGWQLPSSGNSTSFGQQTQQAAQGSPFGQILGGATSLLGAVGGIPGLGSIGSAIGGMFGGGGQQYGPPSPYKRGGHFNKTREYSAGGHAPTVKKLREQTQREMPALLAKRQAIAMRGPMAGTPPLQKPQFKKGGHFNKRHFNDGGQFGTKLPPRYAGGYFQRMLPPGYGGRPDPEADARREWETRRPRAPGEVQPPNGGAPVSRRSYDPVSVAAGMFPREARESLSDILGFIPELSASASLRDAVRSSGETSRAILDGDVGGTLEGVGNMGLGLVGAIPGIGVAARGVPGVASATKPLRAAFDKWWAR